MSKAITALTIIAKKSAEGSLKRDANNTTCFAIYQPKAPNKLKQFSKHNK